MPVSSYVHKSYFPFSTKTTPICNPESLCLPKITTLSSKEGFHESIYNGVAILFLRHFANCSLTIKRFTANAHYLGVKKIFVLGSCNVIPVLSAVDIPVKYLELVDRRVFLDLLAMSFIFVTPFKREGLGLSALEAMLHGNVILCPRSGSYVEYVPLINYQFLAEPRVERPDINPQLFSAMSQNFSIAHQYLS
jgi:hypothetical protein